MWFVKLSTITEGDSMHILFLISISLLQNEKDSNGIQKNKDFSAMWIMLIDKMVNLCG